MLGFHLLNWASMLGCKGDEFRTHVNYKIPYLFTICRKTELFYQEYAISLNTFKHFNTPFTAIILQSKTVQISHMSLWESFQRNVLQIRNVREFCEFITARGSYEYSVVQVLLGDRKVIGYQLLWGLMGAL